LYLGVNVVGSTSALGFVCKFGGGGEGRVLEREKYREN
jgi:hypothetical protein